MKKTDLEQFEKSLPGLIQARRKLLGLTLQELADRAGLSPAFLSQAERGLTTPSLISILKLAGALEVALEYFVTLPSPTRWCGGQMTLNVLKWIRPSAVTGLMAR